jgi:hypothetical protein
MEIVLIIFIPCLIKLSKRNTSFSRTTPSALILLTTFDTFGNALKLTSKIGQHHFLTIVFRTKSQKSFISRKQVLVDDILMRKLPITTYYLF